MADDRSTPRPRRAIGADEPTPDGPDAAVRTPETPQSGSGTAEGSGLPGRFTEEEARPIYREAAHDADEATVRTRTSSADSPTNEAAVPTEAVRTEAVPTEAVSNEAVSNEASPENLDAEADEPGSTRTSRLNFTPRRPVEDTATTVLPRTTAAGATPPPLVDDDVDELDERPRRLGRRARWALLAGAVAAVVVVGLAIGYAVVGVRDQPGTGGDVPPTATSSAGAPSATALLDDASMLAPEGAQPIDPKRTWTAAGTIRGPIPDGSGPGCLGSDPIEGAPTPQQTITRTLTASGSSAPSALHVAQAYASPEDATQAFAVTSRALGTCAVPGDWLFSGRLVDGLGDQATAVAVRSVSGGQTTQHWVVLSRTGRVLDVIDASTPAKTALNVDTVAQSLASVVTGQCGPAGGACPTAVTTTDGPPPIGGDEPGLLAVGDLPPAGSTTAPWVGTPVEPPGEDFTGSQCESVNWTTTAATDRTSRVYLLQDVPGIFGLNEIVLTAKDADAAAKLVEKIRTDWTTCKERKLTATVDSPTKVSGIAADAAPVSGYTTVVEQKAGTTTTRFRVGIASSGTKVAFVFLNPQKGLDVDNDAWKVVAVRAAQRATQQS